MGPHRQSSAETHENLCELLDWQFAERNDQAVAQALYSGQGVDTVYGLDDVGLLDGFFAFLGETGIKAHWQTLVIEGARYLLVPAIMFVLLYGTRILFGIESSNALPALLFSNVAAMTLLGFNAEQVADGMSKRGATQRTAASEYTLMDPQTLAGAICKISASALEELFNGTIRALAAFGVFMAEVMVAVDGTRVVTAPTFQGCGKLAVTEYHHNRQGVRVEIVRFLFGWRLIALIDLRTLIPLAIKIVQIQTHEAPYLVALVQQAQANLAPHSRIVKVVIDRAYVDGPSLHALHDMGITFVVIAKSNMVVRDVALAEQEGTPIYERSETVRRGQGREASTEVWVSRVRVVSDLRQWENYRPPVEEGQRLTWENRPVLTAVIVNLWRNRTPNLDGDRVYLTNIAVSDPWTVVDGYDDRSWVENGLFRNSKQFWKLTRWFPQKTEAGVHSHLTFVAMMIAVATAFRLWDRAQAGALAKPSDHQIVQVTHRVINAQTGEVQETPEPKRRKQTHLASRMEEIYSPPAKPTVPNWSHEQLEGQGPLRWRRRLRRENRDKVIVFVGHLYGIFYASEMLVLSGVPVRNLPPHLGSRDDVLRRYGCLPDV
jgi:Transposase DDE domain